MSLPSLNSLPPLSSGADSIQQTIQLGPGQTGVYNGSPSGLVDFLTQNPGSYPVDENGNEVPLVGARPDASAGATAGSGATGLDGSTPSTDSGLLGSLKAMVPAAGLLGDASPANLLFSARLIVLVVGIILIAAGLFTFKQTQAVIEGTTKIAKKGAELAAA